MSRRGYAATVMPDRRELKRMQRWDRQCAKSIKHIDHSKASLKHAVMAEIREFAR